MHFDRARIAVADELDARELLPAQHHGEVGLGPNAPPRSQQIGQDVELAAGEIEVGPIDGHDPRLGIQSHALVLQPADGSSIRLGSRRGHRCRRGGLGRHVVTRTTQHRIDPGTQFTRSERLGDVVVGARLQTLQCVDLLGARAEHDDVGGACSADPLGGLEAVHSRHVDVEGRDQRLMLANEVEARLPGARTMHGETGLRKDGREQRPDVFLILDHDRDARFFHRCTFRRRRPDRRRPDVGHDIPERRLELPVRVAHRRVADRQHAGLREGREASPRASAPADARWTVWDGDRPHDRHPAVPRPDPANRITAERRERTGV